VISGKHNYSVAGEQRLVLPVASLL